MVEARKNGARLPWSYWHDRPLDLDEYLAAPLIADPVCRFDCDMPVDGVAAFVLTTAERARDLPNRPVYVAGYASGQPTRHRLPLHWPLDDIIEVGAETARRLWERAGVGPDEVDLPQVYDGFSPFVWFWLEVLGLLPGRRGAPLRRRAAASTATRPARCRRCRAAARSATAACTACPQMLECYLQLAGRAGERQRDDATVGVACHSSPHFGGAVVYSEPMSRSDVRWTGTDPYVE